MRKLSQVKGEEALDLIADIIVPLSDIFSDPILEKMRNDGTTVGRLAKAMIKGHKDSVFEILAILEGVKPEEYNPTLPEIIKGVTSFMSDPLFNPLFQSQGRNQESASSGSVMVNTEATEQR